jgi:ABC-type polysaccharide/polyol phosphate export permease
LVGIVDGFRASLLGQPFDWLSLSWAALVSVAALIGSAYLFRSVERSFADVI